MAGGLYSPSAGDVLTAANAIDYWSKQVVIICTSGTRPASPRSGMTCWQTDTLTYIVYGTAWCETTPYSALVLTSESTSSTSYTDLATSGPAVTVATGTKAIVTVSSYRSTAGAGHQALMGWAVSSATTLAASDNYCAEMTISSSSFVHGTRTMPYTSLTAGSNVFTSKYKDTAGTGTNFLRRDITVVGIPT